MGTQSSPVVVGIVEQQPKALRFALAEARARHTDLQVVHSFAIPSSGIEFYLAPDTATICRDAGQQVLDDARRFLEPEAQGVHVEYVLGSGPAAAMLLVAAATAQLVVLGADDENWIDRILGGHVPSFLAQQAWCPVVVVPETTTSRDGPGGVVVTVDGDTAAEGPLEFGFEHAERAGVDLHVLHAIPAATTPADEESHRLNVAEVMAGWADRFPDVMVHTSITRNDPAEAAIEATSGASLVVVGRPRPSLRAFAWARPVAVTVLRGARCPVAVVPAKVLAEVGAR